MSELESDLIKLIKDKIIEKWDKRNEPYLLSSVGSDCKGEITLKKILNGKRLKEWVTLKLDDLGAELAAHPTQKEKIGLIPKGEHYEYDTQKPSRIRKIHTNQNHVTRKEITIAFLSILGDLSTEDADKIIIPTSVLSKLLGD